MCYDIVPMLYHIIYLYMRASGCRTEIRIKNYDHQQRRRRFVECAAREGENEYHILYSNILILLCEIVLPIIMLKCRILIIIIRSSSSIHRQNIIHTSYAFIFILYTRLHRCVCIKTCLSNGDGRRTILLLLTATVHTKV